MEIMEWLRPDQAQETGEKNEWVHLGICERCCMECIWKDFSCKTFRTRSPIDLFLTAYKKRCLTRIYKWPPLRINFPLWNPGVLQEDPAWRKNLQALIKKTKDSWHREVLLGCGLVAERHLQCSAWSNRVAPPPPSRCNTDQGQNYALKP